MRKKRPKSLVLFGNGINCERETFFAHELAGFSPDLIHIYELLERPHIIHRYAFITLPGGFLDGDDLGSAKAQAVKWKYQPLKGRQGYFIDELIKFVNDGKCILGICNGFQLLVKTGLLPGLGGSYKEQTATLTFNDSGKFEDRWVYLKVNKGSPCIFLLGLDHLYLPVRHGEGKFVAKDEEVLKRIKEENHIGLQYTDREGYVTHLYPWNPNGSQEAIAGICDRTGRIFGLMPHPEAYVDRFQHPRWMREKLPSLPDGLCIFKNAYAYCAQNL
ncbi:MAG: phosphoribosylformylglycinamidine synthase subunit PurQ [Desulfobacterota bacterium]|nr:phosphoribosylformylglycinamidine synthase subunit PurQ [Thermodesulfobacteriota bacterium]MDW8001758.1 phosphoribosylformylglycinamidine synthase subunit PurQ [Deltaproteobacteria bacterium]